jgi:hypothetical protein
MARVKGGGGGVNWALIVVLILIIILIAVVGFAFLNPDQANQIIPGLGDAVSR